LSNQFFQVDAFTERPFAGNPAAVMFLDSFPDDSRLRTIAAEMDLSEAAFVVPDGRSFQLRWFTPLVEVDLCGHATLAAAHVLWETRRLAPNEAAVFETRSGRLTAQRSNGSIEMSFPTLPLQESSPPDGLIEALRVDPLYVGLSRFDYLVQVESAAEVRGAVVDFRRLAGVESRGVILTAISDDACFDFVSRFFAPAAGIDEDPVTGSAHCVLGAFWRRILGKNALRAYQASPRGGAMTVHVNGDQTTLTGQAVIVIRGALLA
jgi:PhzF family phenazine biosynthesis protein